jgi:hypothetical protein
MIRTKRGQLVLPLLGDHDSRSEQLYWGNYFVAGLGSHWAGVRADYFQTDFPLSSW